MVFAEKYVRIVITNILTEVFSIYYLSTNRSALVACIAQTVYVLHHSKYTAICSIDAVADGFNRFDLFFDFKINSLPCPKFFFQLHKNLFLLFHL